MKPKEISEYRQQVRDILSGGEGRLEKLEQLAKKVGAGFVHTKTADVITTQLDKETERLIIGDPISESVLVLNINNALQTETMIDACRTSAENYKIAVTASKTSIVSAIAAWAAVVVGVLIAIFK